MHQYGIEFGGHSQNHLALSNCDVETMKSEIADCKKDIEALINKRVVSFSYPFGATNEEVKRIVKESGYSYGISTNTGPLNFQDDLFQIRRIEVSWRTRLYRYKKKVSGKYFL